MIKQNFSLDLLESHLRLHTADNPIRSEELESFFGVSGAIIRDGINALRKKGVPVCNTLDNGQTRIKIYFIAKHKREAEATIQDLWSRETSIRKARLGLEGSFGNIGQIEMRL